MKKKPALLLLAGLLASGTSWAGTIYRCDVDGARSYVSKRIPGAGCHVISQYSPRKPQRAWSAPARSALPAMVAASNFVPSRPVDRDTASVATAAIPAPAASGAPRVVQGQIYSYMEGGVRHYSSRRPQGVANASAVRTIRYSYMETCFACAARPGMNFASIRLKPDAYRSEITTAASQFGVDEAIVRAIIHAESSYNPNALSRVGAQGLMQLMPGTARRFGVLNAFDPAQNIRGGVQYLAFLLKRFNGNLALAAAGYNAGEGAVDKYRGIPPYNETQRYVQRVSLLADRYRSAPVLR